MPVNAAAQAKISTSLSDIKWIRDRRFNADTIVAMERSAQDRWGNGDPGGYLEVMAPEVTYFDPTQGKCVDGLDAIKEYVRPLIGKIKIDRYEMINPTVQREGNTAVFRLIDGKWKIIHSPFSFTKPIVGS